MASLESCDDLFNYEKCEFNNSRLVERLRQLSLMFSEKLVFFISVLLREEESDRPDFIIIE